MKDKSVSKGSKGTKLFVAVIGVALVIGIGAAVVLATLTVPKTQDSEDNPRTIFWRHIHGLGINSVDRDVLYVATHGDFYKSVNGGSPIKVDELRADYMAFNSPMNAGTPLYASGHPATGGNTGLIKSADGGKTWDRVATILDPPVDFHAMSISQSDPNTIIGYDSAGRGLFKTIDAGNTWTELPIPDYITTLAIEPTNSNTIFAGFAGSQKGIARSDDGGISWTVLDQYKGLTIFALVFDENGVLYASTTENGFSRSSDQGKTWESINTPNLTVMTMAVDAQNNILYIAGYVPDGYQEVYKSSDDGNTWDLIGTNKEL